MKRAVVDASVAVKWVLPEPGSVEALQVRARFNLCAPDLIVAECANVLWKNQVRGDFAQEEIALAALALSRMDVDLHSMIDLSRWLWNGQAAFRTQPMTASTSRWLSARIAS